MRSRNEKPGKDAAPVQAPPKAKAAAPRAVVARSRRPAVKRPSKPRKLREKPSPPRIRARWGIFNSSVKQVAVFDYNQRDAADKKLAELRTTFKGLYYLQVVKDLMPESAPIVVQP